MSRSKLPSMKEPISEVAVNQSYKGVPAKAQRKQKIDNGMLIADRGSLQKVQGHRTAQGHRAGVNADLTSSTGGPVGHACR